MITEFSFKNFISYKDKATLSMIANNIKMLEENIVEFDERRILKTAVVYGANASGKTNIFKAITKFLLIIRNSNNFDKNTILNIPFFKFDEESKNNLTEFEIKFIHNKNRYCYGFKADNISIHNEYLYSYPNGRETRVFERYNISEYIFPQKEEALLKDIASKNMNNKLFLSTATNWNYSKTAEAYQFLASQVDTFSNLEELKNMAFDSYLKNNNELKEFALKVLKETDFNIVDYEIKKVEIPKELLRGMPDAFKQIVPLDTKAFLVEFKHKNTETQINFDEESLGTQMIFSIIPFIWEALKHSRTLCIDELDKSVHSDILNYIVKLFNDGEKNLNGSQLIFNTHNTNILSKKILRKDQIWFAEKNSETGESKLESLNTKISRNTDNHEKKYRNGDYGAIPNIRKN